MGTTAPAQDAPAAVLEMEKEQTQLTLPREQLEQLVESGSTLEIRRDDATVRLDAAALAAAAGKGEGNVILSLKTLDRGHLTEAQRKAVEEKELVAAVEISLYCGETGIHELGGKATVCLPFDPGKGNTGRDYRVYWLSDDGQLEPMDTEYKDGALCFTTDHFSTFVVLRTKAAGSGSSWLVPVLLILAVLAGGGVTAFLVLRKTRIS